MPVQPSITRKEIVASITDRVMAYNRNRNRVEYNRAYASFSAKRTSDISLHGSIEGWLSSDAAAPCIMLLLGNFGMNSRGSELVSLKEFTANLIEIPKRVKIQIISALKVPTGGLNVSIAGSNVEGEIRALFDYCDSPGIFSKSGGFVIGSKVAHCILPELCPMLDTTHIAMSLYNVALSEYLPPGNNWHAYLGRQERSPVNPSPRGAGRYIWDSYRFTQAIAFYERIYFDWQIANGNPGLTEFLKLDPVSGTTGVPRVIDKVLW